jgi:hypothetical protein
VRILFDQGTPQPLRRHLTGHTVDTVFEQGWSTLTNGVLLTTAEQAGYDLFITTDQNLRYQQNLTGRRIGIVVLRTTSWPRIGPQITQVQVIVAMVTLGSYHEIAFDAVS